uniref:25S rRNA (uridine-N(3))-methyltransferase BMT5-like domain-containing protein n=1 Tax=Colletotrichum fructicola (strain Nara gc5) TaxID=1213859 RepID=L2G3Y9_COLFN
MGKKRTASQITHKNHFVDSAKKRKPNGPPSSSKKSKQPANDNPAKKKAQQQYHQNQEPLRRESGDAPTATVLEKNEKELLEKYPHADENIAQINHPGSRPKPKTKAEDGNGENDEEDEDANEDSPAADEEEDDEDAEDKPSLPPNNNKILYNIDARTMKPFTRRTTSQNHHGTATTTKHGLYKRIIFNFPHVGGKYTDVNRQVRYNQELLVAFFKSALPSLAPRGTLVVTLFEGHPYTLWNIKDLGRHAGLQALQSFRFHARAYPGYRHARTLGVVREKKGTGEASGNAWRGEDRPARSFVFMRTGEAPEALPAQKKKKRKGGEESSSDEESDFDDEVGDIEDDFE